MKACERFHVEDVERGDRLFLGGGRTQEFSDEPDPDVTVTVRSCYSTHNFGWVVQAEEREDPYYLDDYNVVRQAT